MYSTLRARSIQPKFPTCGPAGPWSPFAPSRPLSPGTPGTPGTPLVEVLMTVGHCPTWKSGPPQKVDQFFRNFFGWTEPIHLVLDRNFRKFWLNGSRPTYPPNCQSPIRRLARVTDRGSSQSGAYCYKLLDKF